MSPIPAQVLDLFRQGENAEAEQDWPGAILAYQQALDHAPSAYPILFNLANLLWLTEQLDQAETILQRALKIAPGEGRLWRLQGVLQRDLNRFEEALEAFNRASALGWEDGITAWSQSEVLMGLGRYRDAFRLAEERLEEPSYVPLFHRPPPYWEGWSTPSVPIRIWSEQGFGDTLQYVRWLPGLGHHRDVIIEVDPPLVTLLQRGLAWMPRPPQVMVKESWPQSCIGCQGSLLSLPHRLGDAPLPLPGPYLLDPAWEPRPKDASRPPKVGVVWASGQRQDNRLTHRLYQRRSLPKENLLQLLRGLSAEGAELVNLQVGADRDAADNWEGRFADSLDQAADFAEMASVMAKLDLTISVDTAAAHLAGATGQYAWILLPWNGDGRWMRSGRSTPWYPELRLWRQPSRGNWHELISQVLKEFRTWCHHRPCADLR